jgi:hypothetical protein
MNEMSKQMEMFDDGGLMDEGGTVDPVSGNDVPPGSTQEEVRDDIPAQLSEGEFVFPADVVRFIGLEKLMMIRQRAKAGLQRMEDMGQMGNSEEAVMPDDLPFSIEDLDMEDDGLEMAQGGVVQAANGTFVQPTPTTPNAGVFYNPAAQPTTGVAAAPMQAASASAAPSVGQAATPVQAASAGQPTMFTNYQLPQAPVPVMTAPDQLPKFLGEVAPGVGGVDYTEEVYVNEAGQTVTFRRYTDGRLLDSSGNEAVIPEGYTIKSEAEKDVGTGPVKVETATVQDDGDGRDNNNDPDGLGTSGGRLSLGGTYATSGPAKGARTGVTQFGVSYDIPGQKFGGIPQFAMNYKDLLAGTLPDTTVVSLQRYGLTTDLAYKDFLSLKNNPMSQKSQDIIGGFDLANLAGANQVSINENLDFVDKNGKAATYGATVVAGAAIANTLKPDNIFGTNIGKTFDEKYADLSDVERGLVDNHFSAEEEKDAGKGMTLGDIPSDISTPEAAIAYANAQRAKADKAKADKARADKAKADKARADKAAIDSYVEQSTGRDSDFGGFDDVSSTGDAEDEGDFAFAKGGLAKQMKRSGLASKK